MVKQFRTLELAKQFYQQCHRIKMSGALHNQFQRASPSVLLNIVEGSAKPSTKERARFYSISYANLKETSILLELSGNEYLLKNADILSAHLWKLRQNPGGV